ncbi:nitrate/nitrite transporter [Oceanobacillus sp. Castelsardo]|uniref:MFS transporter n=1 Tax=Oceanobacillus sp. Castelsardo TaxID=1851204 RepID=UPI00083831D6|nr:MFS transporter [Oceanobacillus sp. Castelsardo]
MDKQNGEFRWIVFASVLCSYLLMSSQRTAPGLITDQLMADFSVTATTIGLVTSIQFFVYTALQIPMGILADRYGPNFFLIAGAILTGLGTIIYSLGTHEFTLFFARILTGIGDATVWVNLVLILGQWFNAKEFTRLIGVAGMSGSLGFLLATVPFSTFIVFVGWRKTFLLAGILLCLCGVLLYFVLVKKPNKPLFEKRGMQCENTWLVLKRILSNRQAWAIFLSHFGVVGAYLGLIGSWAVPYGMEIYGLSRTDASQLIMISLVGALIGAPFLSWLASRIGMIKRPFVVFHLILLFCWSSILLFHGKPPFMFLVIIMFVIGFAFGSNSLTFALVRISFPENESGIVSGFANTGGFLSAVLLPGIFGKILDQYQSVGDVGAGYFYGFITPVIFSVIGLVGVVYIKDYYQEK